MPAPESTTQMTLASDRDWLTRLEYNMVMAARTILSESGVGVTHGARAGYARTVISHPGQAAALASPMIVGGTNIIGTVTVDGSGKATTTATDGAVFSQVNAFWNALAGIDTGN